MLHMALHIFPRKGPTDTIESDPNMSTIYSYIYMYIFSIQVVPRLHTQKLVWVLVGVLIAKKELVIFLESWCLVRHGIESQSTEVDSQRGPS